MALSVLASATATLTLNLLARLDWRRVRAWTRPASKDTPAEPGELLEARQGACGCLTTTGAVALLHEQGYLPVGQLGSGRELLANDEAAAAVWPSLPDRIAAVQFGTLRRPPFDRIRRRLPVRDAEADGRRMVGDDPSRARDVRSLRARQEAAAPAAAVETRDPEGTVMS